MNNSNRKKNEQLGMSYGSACHRLRKSVLFVLLQRAGMDYCHRCGNVIESVRDLSLEHIEPWLDSDNPSEMFFDLDNIAFSHLRCNCQAAKNPIKGDLKHPSISAYRKGCRCDECKELTRLRMQDYRKRKELSKLT